MKDYEKALYYLNKSIEIDNTHPDYLLNRAILYIDTIKFKKAI